MFHSGSSNHCISYHDSINFRIWRARRYMYRGRALQHFLTVQDCHKLLSSFGWIWDISKRGLEEIKRSRCSKLCFLPVFCSKLQIKHDLVCITLHRIWLAYAFFFLLKAHRWENVSLHLKHQFRLCNALLNRPISFSIQDSCWTNQCSVVILEMIQHRGNASDDILKGISDINSLPMSRVQ